MNKKYVQGQFTPQNPQKYSGKYPIIYRSSWELRVMGFFDKNPNVKKWTSESLVIPYYDPIAQRQRRYFPDFTVEYFNAYGVLIKEIIEIKPSNVADPILTKTIPERGKRQTYESYHRQMAVLAQNMHKWNAVKEAAKRMGYTFRVLTEKDGI